MQPPRSLKPMASMNEQTTPPTMTFADFDLDPALIEAISTLGFETPTPIQAAAIPPLLAGRDVIGRARTGSGKTAAFGLPLLQRIKGSAQGTRALVLAPTRELALQVSDALRGFATDLGDNVQTVYGGAAYGPQIRALSHGVPVVVGTPGRLIDHLDKGTLKLDALEIVVIDEADEMLRMGFIEDVERLLAATPPGRQVALFSATMPPEYQQLARKYLNDPVQLQVETSALTTSHIEQRWVRVPEAHKLDALVRVLQAEPRGAALVFARTRVSCAEVAEALVKRGIAAEPLHGDLTQPARERVLARLRDQSLDVVVATDVASRGIDVEHITHVINLDLPTDTESYVHRIGRTGRAGREGAAISFVDPSEQRRRYQINRRLKAEMQEMQVPSEADIAARQRADLLAALEATTAEARFEEVEVYLARLREAWIGDDAGLAAALLALLSAERRLIIKATPNPAPPSWAQPPARPTRPSASSAPRAPRWDTLGASADEVEVFIPIGSKRGVRPGDIVGALTHGAGLPGSAIGRVHITEWGTFVSMPEAVAVQLLEHAPDLFLKGHKAPMSLATERAERNGPPPRRKPGTRPTGNAGAPHARRKGAPPQGRRGSAPRPRP
ncbi:DEAD/DEAH box helicase [Myxococcota bacterium]|nr:DEAD/DEAH box helicase [Myxococcota bacterium]MBU1430562.1 DEAD/DEAH box helicase [Myxococcota bacterium]MBU1900702.1 DEAD/DEAH box helicase [Myxococcota bacterium]